jgi:excinuclease ABC subunit A
VVVIEHNVDVVAVAELRGRPGPRGGECGGELVAWGTPEEVARVELSRTAPFLRFPRSVEAAKSPT